MCIESYKSKKIAQIFSNNYSIYTFQSKDDYSENPMRDDHTTWILLHYPPNPPIRRLLITVYPRICLFATPQSSRFLSAKGHPTSRDARDRTSDGPVTE